MFEGFERERIAANDAEINLKVAGEGPPVLLLHGFPQTHVAWHEIAPALADDHTVVVPDLRGYGDSIGPPDPTAADYTHRRMAEDMVTVMDRLGFDTYAVVGHDRGGRIGYRYALDHPDRVRRLAVLDIVPTLETAERMDYESAKGRYHWLFLAQPNPVPETLINAESDFYLEHILENWAADRDALDPDAVAEYRRAYRKESVVRAGCEDYRAGLSLDLEHDRASRSAGEKIECPLLVLWGSVRDRDSLDILEIWEPWASDMRGESLPCGHFLMEEAPQETLAKLRSFLS